MTGNPLVCAHGETGEGWPGPHHCHLCAQKVDEAVTFMAVAFALGTHDAEGYTPNERKAQRKRKMAGGVDSDTGASRSAPVPEPTEPPVPTHPIVEPTPPTVPGKPDQGLPGDRPDRGRPGRPEGGDRPDQGLPETPEPKK